MKSFDAGCRPQRFATVGPPMGHRTFAKLVPAQGHKWIGSSPTQIKVRNQRNCSIGSNRGSLMEVGTNHC
eukprot:977020-Rhodomonas_salina.1